MAGAHYPRGDRSAADLSAMLGARADDVCRTYLPNGRIVGGKWRVGNVAGEPGQSLWVSLRGNDRGRWKDEAVPEHNGDMLDLIRAVKGIGLTDAMDEAALFLGLPPPEPAAKAAPTAGRAFAGMLREARPVTPDDPAGRYLASRGLAAGDAEGCWFHPTLWVQVDGAKAEAPALIVPLTDAAGQLRAVHRIYLTEDGGKAAFGHHKRTSGSGKGAAARFGAADAERVVLCEGVEDALAVLRVLEPEERRGVMVAASAGAGRIAGVELHGGVRRILHMQDGDRAGEGAWEALQAHWGAGGAGISLVRARPQAKDANDELVEHGRKALRTLLEPLFAAETPTEPEADVSAAEGTEAGDMPGEAAADEGKPDRPDGPEGIGTGDGEAAAAGGGANAGGGTHAEDGPADGRDGAGTGARLWAAFEADWNAFWAKTQEDRVHPYGAEGYEDIHARMRVLHSLRGLDPGARSWLGEQLAIHNGIRGRWRRAEEIVLGLRFAAERRQAVADSGGDILRAGRYRAWKEEERRLAAAGVAMLGDPDYAVPLDGIEYSREWIEWAADTIPSWHAGDAQRLEAVRGAGAAW